MTIWAHSFDSSIGPIHLASDEESLLRIALPGEIAGNFEEQVAAESGKTEIARGGAINTEAEGQLKAYLSGKLRHFELPLKITGGAFRRQVLEIVAGIEYGRTRTYGDIAVEMGKPGAARAVGQANGSNRLPLVVPCHRVVAASGLGGYAGGLDLKRHLLKLEGARLDLAGQGNLFDRG